MGNTPNSATSHEGDRPPLAIWPCAPHDLALHTHQSPQVHNGEVLVPQRLAGRLVDEYTLPGHTVADLTRAGEVAEQARIQGRGHKMLSPTLDAPGAPTATGDDLAWADLTVATFTGATSCTTSPGARRRRARARVEFASLITRPGGIVAVITAIGHTPAGVVDPAPGVVRAAAFAGLVYLQHVIALTVPICEAGLGATIPVRGKGGFDPELPEREQEGEAGLPASVAEAAATITWPAHLNVSVFRKKGRSATAVTGGQVSA